MVVLVVTNWYQAIIAAELGWFNIAWYRSGAKAVNLMIFDKIDFYIWLEFDTTNYFAMKSVSIITW